jgi:DNA mismatch repair protein MutS
MEKESLGIKELVEKGVKLTPMMQQYYDIRKNYPDIILFFRMGDFYEVFFEDAKKTSKLLNISLTHRGKLGDYPIPMAGIPHHAAATYIDRLTNLGHKVAICEQVEDPKEAKGIVKRAVTQVVSPGMPFDLDKAEKTEQKFIACAQKIDQDYYLIMIDYTTGDFFGLRLNDSEELCEKILLYSPKEFIQSLGQWDDLPQLQDTLKSISVLQTHLSEDYFNSKFTELYTQKLIPGFKRDEVLKMHTGILSPIGALSYYISSTQELEKISHIRPFKLVNTDQTMKISYPTLVGLEIFPKSKETYKNSLLGFMDHTCSSMGARSLKSLFSSPLYHKEAIDERQEMIQYFLDHVEVVEDIRLELDELRDIERIMAKVSTKKVNGPDLLNLAKSVEIYNHIKSKKVPTKNILPEISKANEKKLMSLATKINQVINDEIGATLDKGNLIKKGFNKERDRLYNLSQNAHHAMLELEEKYRKETGIPNLRLKHNNVAGYFIEISKSHTKKVPKSFIRRQTLVNSERYQNEEVANFEKEMISAKEKLSKLEREIFNELVLEVEKTSATILKLASYLGLYDAMVSLAVVALNENFSRPIFSKEKLLEVQSAWHPLIKANINDQFVCHNLKLDQNQFFGLVTGPNMAGKTTVMREMAIIQFLSQLGSFVPAKSVKLSLCDYIFSRLGAHDDIVKGQSTFMVEMSETAEILRHASQHSLIILDEIGRGTSTYDGLSIAWALVEHFANSTQALTLFSTHYHELIDLADSLGPCKNLTVKTKNNRGNVEFLYELIEAGATQSFGIHVAKMAGLPKEILKRSNQVLKTLEKDHKKTDSNLISETNQLNFFQTSDENEDESQNELYQEFEKIDTLNMTPLEALQKLHDIKSQLFN